MADELSFKVGDIIAVITVDESGWWTGEPINMPNTGAKIFPSNYVSFFSAAS